MINDKDIHREDELLTYLTAHTLPAVIRHYARYLITEKNEETLAEFSIVSYKNIAEMSVGIANAALEKINQVNQQKLKNAYVGENDGWRWEIRPWDVNFLDNTVMPETKWYVNIRGRERWLTADGLDCPQEALSAISVFCKFHPKGKINSDNPIKPFKVNYE